MAQTIGTHGLYCPDPQDYAAYALYMQDLANRIDAALSAQQDALNGFLNSEIIIVTNSATQGIAPNGFDDSLFDTVVFNNSTFFSYADEGGRGTLRIGSAAGISPIVPYPQGAYTYGFNVRFTDVGAPTVNSHRYIQAIGFDETAVPSANLFNEFDWALNMNTGGEEGVLIQNSFRLDGENGFRIRHSAANGDPAITVNVVAGHAIMWCMYNGPTDVIEVA